MQKFVSFNSIHHLSGRKSMINCVEENIIYGRISQTSKVFIIFKKCIFDKEHPHLIITAKTLYQKVISFFFKLRELVLQTKNKQIRNLQMLKKNQSENDQIMSNNTKSNKDNVIMTQLQNGKSVTIKVLKIEVP